MSKITHLSPFQDRAEIAVVLGSGLSGIERIAERIESIPYTAIPGFASPTVAGHPGRLSLCRIDRIEILLFAGRFHLYEGADLEDAGRLVLLAKRLGCNRMLITQAAGSLRPDLSIGSWMLPGDIVSLPWKTGLPKTSRDGRRTRGGDPLSGRRMISPRFRQSVRSAALEAGVDLHEGTLLFSIGPAYETAAEARAGAFLGADAATMSSLPELYAASAAGIEPALLSWITNQTANLSGGTIDHGEVVRRGGAGARILLKIIAKLAYGNYKFY